MGPLKCAYLLLLALQPSNGFLIIEANGGLNQQRIAVSKENSRLNLFLWELTF